MSETPKSFRYVRTDDIHISFFGLYIAYRRRFYNDFLRTIDYSSVILVVPRQRTAWIGEYGLGFPGNPQCLDHQIVHNPVVI